MTRGVDSDEKTFHTTSGNECKFSWDSKARRKTSLAIFSSFRTGHRSQVRSQVAGQVTGQVTGHRPQVRSQATGQVTGHKRKQEDTGQNCS